MRFLLLFILLFSCQKVLNERDRSINQFKRFLPADPQHSAPKKYVIESSWGWQEVFVTPFDDLHVLYEGDILLSKKDLHNRPPKGSLEDSALEAFSVSRMDSLWEGGIVPYDANFDFDHLDEAQIKTHYGFSQSLDLSQYRDEYMVTNAKIKSAMNEWMAKTPLKFVPRTNEKFYIRFQYVFNFGGGLSEIGNVKAVDGQVVLYGPFCANHCITHELGHVIGLWHEQSRPDRDQFIQIMTTHIDPEQLYNFSTRSLTTTQYLNSYDLKSLMHYESSSFSKDGSPTILIQPEVFSKLTSAEQSFFTRTITTPNGETVTQQAVILDPAERIGPKFYPSISEGDATSVKNLYEQAARSAFLSIMYKNLFSTNPDPDDLSAIENAVKLGKDEELRRQWLQQESVKSSLDSAFQNFYGSPYDPNIFEQDIIKFFKEKNHPIADVVQLIKKDDFQAKMLDRVFFNAIGRFSNPGEIPSLQGVPTGESFDFSVILKSNLWITAYRELLVKLMWKNFSDEDALRIFKLIERGNLISQSLFQALLSNPEVKTQYGNFYKLQLGIQNPEDASWKAWKDGLASGLSFRYLAQEELKKDGAHTFFLTQSSAFFGEISSEKSSILELEYRQEEKWVDGNSILETLPSLLSFKVVLNELFNDQEKIDLSVQEMTKILEYAHQHSKIEGPLLNIIQSTSTQGGGK